MPLPAWPAMAARVVWVGRDHRANGNTGDLLPERHHFTSELMTGDHWIPGGGVLPIDDVNVRPANAAGAYGYNDLPRSRARVRDLTHPDIAGLVDYDGLHCRPAFLDLLHSKQRVLRTNTSNTDRVPKPPDNM